MDKRTQVWIEGVDKLLNMLEMVRICAGGKGTISCVSNGQREACSRV